MFSKSEQLFSKAKQVFPGGVNSPVRAFKAVDSTPVYIKSASGAYLEDIDENKYLDYIGSWGPAICGHNHPQVVKAVCKAAEKGLSFGACHELELELGEQVLELMPNLQMLRFVTSGTEACMAAIRLARAYTQRPQIIKFSGCYHGHYDSFLVQAGSGVATLGLPDSPGVLSDLAKYTLTLPYNNLEEVEQAFSQNPNSIAAIIVEPVVGNAGCILPQNSFLVGLKQICEKYKALLIFDEVMTGFRVALGGAQERFNIKPDLTCLGKIIGGGLPVGAYAGRSDIMEMIAPSGPVYQAGTLASNPVAMAAGLATLKLLKEEKFYINLENMGSMLELGLRQIFKEKSIPVVLNRCGSMLSVFFSTEKEILNYQMAQTSKTKLFAKFFNAMLQKGVYLPPSQFEAWFFSAAHKENQIEQTLEIAKLVLKSF